MCFSLFSRLTHLLSSYAKRTPLLFAAHHLPGVCETLVLSSTRFFLFIQFALFTRLALYNPVTLFGSITLIQKLTYIETVGPTG